MHQYRKDRWGFSQLGLQSPCLSHILFWSLPSKGCCLCSWPWLSGAQSKGLWGGRLGVSVMLLCLPWFLFEVFNLKGGLNSTKTQKIFSHRTLHLQFQKLVYEFETAFHKYISNEGPHGFKWRWDFLIIWFEKSFCLENGERRGNSLFLSTSFFIFPLAFPSLPSSPFFHKHFMLIIEYC